MDLHNSTVSMSVSGVVDFTEDVSHAIEAKLVR